MTRNTVSQRPESCQQILNNRNLWALMDNEFNINKEFKEFPDNCDEEYKKSYVYKVIELMIKYNSEVSNISENSYSPALRSIKTSP